MATTSSSLEAPPELIHIDMVKTGTHIIPPNKLHTVLEDASIVQGQYQYYPYPGMKDAPTNHQGLTSSRDKPRSTWHPFDRQRLDSTKEEHTVPMPKIGKVFSCVEKSSEKLLTDSKSVAEYDYLSKSNCSNSTLPPPKVISAVPVIKPVSSSRKETSSHLHGACHIIDIDSKGSTTSPISSKATRAMTSDYKIIDKYCADAAPKTYPVTTSSSNQQYSILSSDANISSETLPQVITKEKRKPQTSLLNETSNDQPLVSTNEQSGHSKVSSAVPIDIEQPPKEAPIIIGGRVIKRRKKRTYSYNPKPVAKKQQMKMVPNELKDEEYWMLRKRNNEAAKTSRLNRRKKEMEYLAELKELRESKAALLQNHEKLLETNKLLEEELNQHKKICPIFAHPESYPSESKYTNCNKTLYEGNRSSESSMV